LSPLSKASLDLESTPRDERGIQEYVNAADPFKLGPRAQSREIRVSIRRVRWDLYAHIRRKYETAFVDHLSPNLGPGINYDQVMCGARAAHAPDVAVPILQLLVGSEV